MRSRLVRVKILVLGSGAREHAIILSLLSEDAGHEVVAAPGNAGIGQVATTVDLDPNDPVVVANWAIAENVALVVIGPEAPLVAGVADELREQGIPVFGPGRAAAELEGSKTFAKRVMEVAGVPTGRARRSSTLAEAEAALDAFGTPYVVKADGLAAGKGVLVTTDRDAAVEHARSYLDHGSVLVEEFLDGQEVSLFFVSDGHTVVPLSPAQDYKRLADGDEGPNTGGMGAYSPLPWLDETFGSEQAFVTEVLETIAKPVVKQLAEEQTPFIGLLYAGLILTRRREGADDRGIRVIEFNARFGDPETQVVLPRLTTPLSTLLYAAATGTLADDDRPAFAAASAVTVVLASENYPSTPVTGRVITGLAEADAVPGVHVTHAATGAQGDDLVSTGGRVLSVVALGEDFTEARERAYEALRHIELDGAQFRTDIASRVAN
jgi:phosphoribosylamine--glycine ligase